LNEGGAGGGEHGIEQRGVAAHTRGGRRLGIVPPSNLRGVLEHH
jgi:hypothetical protein